MKEKKSIPHKMSQIFRRTDIFKELTSKKAQI